MAKKQLVLAFFANEAAADEAVKQVKAWDKASKEVKLGARKTGTGAVLGALAAVLTGGATIAAGAVAGGILGAFFKKGLGMSKEDIARISKELDGGKAAVAILAAPDEVAGVSAKLTELGGKPETHEVTEEAIEQAQEAAETTPEEPTA